MLVKTVKNANGRSKCITAADRTIRKLVYSVFAMHLKLPLNLTGEN